MRVLAGALTAVLGTLRPVTAGRLIAVIGAIAMRLRSDSGPAARGWNSDEVLMA